MKEELVNQLIFFVGSIMLVEVGYQNHNTSNSGVVNTMLMKSCIYCRPKNHMTYLTFPVEQQVKLN